VCNKIASSVQKTKINFKSSIEMFDILVFVLSLTQKYYKMSLLNHCLHFFWYVWQLWMHSCKKQNGWPKHLPISHSTTDTHGQTFYAAPAAWLLANVCCILAFFKYTFTHIIYCTYMLRVLVRGIRHGVARCHSLEAVVLKLRMLSTDWSCLRYHFTSFLGVKAAGTQN
jgi:hypothetical protein